MGQEEQGLGAANMPPFGRESMDRDDADDFDDLYADEPPLRYTRRRASGPRERVNEALQDIADRIQGAAERLDDLAEETFGDQEGPLARAGTVARDVAGRMESVADYLRTSDVDSLRQGLERQVRTRPLQSIFLAVGAGWLTGKIFR